MPHVALVIISKTGCPVGFPVAHISLLQHLPFVSAARRNNAVAIAASGAAAPYTNHICSRSRSSSRRSSSTYAPPPWCMHVVLGRGGCRRGMPSDGGALPGPRLRAAPAAGTLFLLLAAARVSKRARARHQKICHHQYHLQYSPSPFFWGCCCYCRPRCCRGGQGTRHPQRPAS